MTTDTMAEPAATAVPERRTSYGTLWAGVARELGHPLAPFPIAAVGFSLTIGVLPAGVGHRRQAQQPGYDVVGGYPPGQDGTVSTPDEVPLEAAIREVAAVPVPETDPVVAAAVGLPVLWR